MRRSRLPAWVPYVAPYAAFLLVTEAARRLDLLPVHLAYPLKAAVTAALLIAFAVRGSYPEVRAPYGIRLLPADVAVGLLSFLLWIAPEGIGWMKLGESSFDPGAAGEGWFWPSVAVRVAGAVVLVPVFEELFVRSFLPRVLDARAGEDWRRLPIGRFTTFSFVATAVVFGLAHHRWAVAIVLGLLWNGYLAWRRSIRPLIVVHAVTNLALAIYVLRTESWSLW